MHILFLPADLQERDYLEDLDVHDRIHITLKLASSKWSLQMWAELIWVRIRSCGRFT
jgi:hypothetical protein